MCVVSAISSCLGSQLHMCSQFVSQALLIGLQQVLIFNLPTISHAISLNLSHYSSPVPTDVFVNDAVFYCMDVSNLFSYSSVDGRSDLHLQTAL